MAIDAKRDLADVTADLLTAEACKLVESQAKLQADFEAHEARFNADLAALVPTTSDGAARTEPAVWLLARKCWSWLYHD